MPHPWARAALAFGALASLVWAQSAAPKPQFEVVSIKPDKSGDRRIMIGRSPGGRLNFSNVTARMLITLAYRLQDFEVLAAPSAGDLGWLDSEHFDVVAKPPDGAQPEPAGRQLPESTRLMMQNMLEDRFQLKSHHETRNRQIYALTVAKGGPKMKWAEGAVCVPPSGPPPPPPQPGQNPTLPCGGLMISPRSLNGRGVSAAQVADVLARILGRTVEDSTGLTRTFDVSLEWAPDSGQQIMMLGPPGGAAPPPADSAGPSLFTALQEQLGLKLESQKSQGDVLVIDHIQRPSDN